MRPTSKATLPQKLGIKERSRVALVNAPREFEHVLGRLPAGAALGSGLRSSVLLDIVLCFVTKRASLERAFPRAANHIVPNGCVWVAWPKKTSGVTTDVNENVVRAVALANGFVDNKLSAIDDTWSGLRCVVRMAHRAKTKKGTPKKRAKKNASASALRSRASRPRRAGR